MQKITVRKIVLGGILLCISLMALFSLFFNVMKLSFPTNSAYVLKMAGVTTWDNGFSFVGGDSIFLNELNKYSTTIYYIAGLRELSVVCRVFNIVFIVAGGFAIALTVLWFFFGKSENLAISALGLSIFVVCGYMVLGIVVRAAVIEGYSYELMANAELNGGIVGVYLQSLADDALIKNWVSMKNLVSANILTYAYVPLIIVALLTVAYFVSRASLSGIVDKEQDNSQNEETSVSIEEQKNDFDFSKLRELKQLFDEGILTEEEFMEQKRLALGKKE